MKKIIIWVIISFFLVLVVGIIFTSLIAKHELETNEYKINDNFENIKIITNTADIEIRASEKDYLICNEEKNIKHSVVIKDNTLLIEIDDNRKWHEHIRINFKTPKITIYLSEKEYNELLIKTNTGNINISNNFKFKNIDILDDTGDIINYASTNEKIKIKTDTGNIYTKNIIANKIDFSTSTGRIDIIDAKCYDDIKINISTGNTKIVDTNCKNLISTSDTGNIYLENVIATEKFSIITNTGDVKFKDSDASDIFVKTDSGNIKGNLLTEKVIFATSSTGKIDVPKIMADEKCEVITDTGDIILAIN